MMNPTLLVSNFDNSLALTDASGTGAWTGADPVRFDGGLWLEQATTNLVINPSFETDTTGWQGFIGSIAKDDTESLYGDSSVKVTTAASNQGITNSTAGYISSGVAKGETFTLSVAGKGAGATIRMLLVERSSANGFLALATYETAALTAGFVRHDFTYTLTHDDVAKLDARVLSDHEDGTAFFLDGFQVEHLPYATSYADASLGDGYGGSAGAFTRSASSASVDPTDYIVPASGAIAFRYRRLIDTAGEEILLTAGNKGTGEDYLEIGIDVNDDPYMEWDSNNTGPERVTITDTIATDTDYFFYFDWDGTDIRASRDNGSLTSDTRAAVEGDLTGNDLVLSAATGSFVIGPFATFNRPLEATEITRLYNSPSWSFGTLEPRTGNRYNIFQLRPRAA